LAHTAEQWFLITSLLLLSKVAISVLLRPLAAWRSTGLAVANSALTLNSTKGRANNAPSTTPAIAGCIPRTLSGSVTVAVKANLNRLPLAST
jgi:hypothetical protein